MAFITDGNSEKKANKHHPDIEFLREFWEMSQDVALELYTHMSPLYLQSRSIHCQMRKVGSAAKNSISRLDIRLEVITGSRRL